MKDYTRHKAHKYGISDHIIDTMANVMRGVGREKIKSPLRARSIYNLQELMGWGHFKKGQMILKMGRTQDKNT